MDSRFQPDSFNWPSRRTWMHLQVAQCGWFEHYYIFLFLSCHRWQRLLSSDWLIHSTVASNMPKISLMSNTTHILLLSKTPRLALLGNLAAFVLLNEWRQSVRIFSIRVSSRQKGELRLEFLFLFSLFGQDSAVTVRHRRVQRSL
jgi:hypothetical protein